MDLPVAVHSSATKEDLATKSFAGPCATYLGICGDERVVNTVRSSWADLCTRSWLPWQHRASRKSRSLAIPTVTLFLIRAKTPIASASAPASDGRCRRSVGGIGPIDAIQLAGPAAPIRTSHLGLLGCRVLRIAGSSRQTARSVQTMGAGEADDTFTVSYPSGMGTKWRTASRSPASRRPAYKD